jgi:hypothetical protein
VDVRQEVSILPRSIPALSSRCERMEKNEKKGARHERGRTALRGSDKDR